MKSLKSLFSIMLVAVVIALASCSKSSDPTPAQKSALDSVKASLTGKWAFKSVTVQQISNGKVGTAVDCSKAGLTSAGFTNTNWQNVTPETTFFYAGGTSNEVSVSYPCLNNGAGTIDPSTVTVTQISPTQFQFYTTSTSGAKTTLTFTFNKKDITSTSVKATFVSNGTAPNSGSVCATLGYVVTYQFTR
jgi:hypothetical protein